MGLARHRMESRRAEWRYVMNQTLQNARRPDGFQGDRVVVPLAEIVRLVKVDGV